MLEVVVPLLRVPALYSVTKEGSYIFIASIWALLSLFPALLLVSLEGIITRAASKSLNSRYLTCTCHEFSRAEWHLTVPHPPKFNCCNSRILVWLLLSLRGHFAGYFTVTFMFIYM